MGNRYSKLLIIIILVTTFAACGITSYNKKLVQIDELTITDPDKAITEIMEIDSEVEHFPKCDKIYYQLLKIKANDKACVEHKSDSNINNLVEYFERTDKNKLPEIYYYAGSVYRDLNDVPQALAFYQKAIGSTPPDDLKLRSNIYFQMANLLAWQFLANESVSMYQKAYSCDSIRKDTIAMANCLQGMAEAIGLNTYYPGLEKKVLYYYNSAYKFAEKTGDEKFIALFSLSLGSVYCNLFDYKSSIPFIEKVAFYLSKHSDDDILRNYYAVKAEQMMGLGKYDSARIYSNFCIANGESHYKQYAYKNLYKICMAEKKYDDASKYMDSYEEWTDSMNNIRATEVTARMHHLYNYQLRERENERLKAESLYKRNLIIILVAASLILLLTFLLYRNKARQERNTLQQKLARLDQFEKTQREQSEEEMRRNNERVDELERKLRETEGKNEETIKQLEAERDELKIAIQSVQLEKAKHDILRSKIFSSETYAMVKNRLDDGKSLSVGDIRSIDECINGICDGFRNTLYSSYKLSRQEYSICLLVKLELNVKEISQLLSRSSSAITLSRKRLFMKLFGREGTANELDTYILSL